MESKMEAVFRSNENGFEIKSTLLHPEKNKQHSLN